VPVRVARGEPGWPGGDGVQSGGSCDRARVFAEGRDGFAVIVGAGDERPAPERARIDDRPRAQACGQRVGVPLRRHQDRCVETKGAIVEGRAGDAAVIDAHGARTMPVWGYEFWVEEGGDAVAQREMKVTITKLVDYIKSIQGDNLAANRN